MSTNTFSFSAKTVRLVLIVWVTFVTVLGATAHYVITQIVPGMDEQLGRGVARAMKVIGLEGEPALQHWYSSLALFACFLLLGYIAIAYKRRGEESRGWALLSLLFCYLALDEGIELHEIVSGPARHWLGVGDSLAFAWVIPYAVLAIIIGLASIRFLLRIDRRTGRLFFIAGVIFCTGALGVETLGGVTYASGGESVASLQYLFFTSLEEFMEMFAIVIMIYALLSHIERFIGPLTLEFHDGRDDRA